MHTLHRQFLTTVNDVDTCEIRRWRGVLLQSKYAAVNTYTNHQGGGKTKLPQEDFHTSKTTSSHRIRVSAVENSEIRLQPHSSIPLNPTARDYTIWVNRPPPIGQAPRRLWYRGTPKLWAIELLCITHGYQTRGISCQDIYQPKAIVWANIDSRLQTNVSVTKPELFKNLLWYRRFLIVYITEIKAY